MARYCKELGRKVLYLECTECESRTACRTLSAVGHEERAHVVYGTNGNEKTPCRKKS